MATKKTAKSIVNNTTGYDAKNRQVILQGNTVTKEATGYNHTFSTAAQAQTAFEFQCACSQN
ncbi:MAG TPA: hypothetical protein PLO59_00145 [Bacteroidia bacterium]|nr:hypothetical protein [Bacteroidia bacterium]